MGCVSSNLLNNEDEFTQLGGSALSHHIVSLTSTTYGLLNLDPPPPPPPQPPQATTTPLTPQPRFTLGSIFPTPLTAEPKSRPEIINSWELMSGLDNDSFRFSPIVKKDQESPNFSPFYKKHQDSPLPSKENTNPDFLLKDLTIIKKYQESPSSSKENTDPNFISKNSSNLLDKFEKLCPPNGENRVVIYTTTLRGIRKTFVACNVVRAAFEGFGVLICERDVSMDKGFKEELRELMRGKESEAMVPPRVFVKGRYVGGVDEVIRLVDEGFMAEVLQGLPKKRVKGVCEGCGDVRFLPCFSCNGSCKLVMVVKEEIGQKEERTVVLRCPDCNENGLVLCPICS